MNIKDDQILSICEEMHQLINLGDWRDLDVCVNRLETLAHPGWRVMPTSLPAGIEDESWDEPGEEIDYLNSYARNHEDVE